MPRIRSIKPAFFFDSELADLPPLTRLFFIGLWTQADKAGRLEDRPRELKAQLLPYDKSDVDEILNSLHPKFVVRYEVEGKRYLWVRTFLKHQKPHHTEAESTLPECISDLTVMEPLKHGNAPVGKEGKGREGSTYSSSRPEMTAKELVEAWNEICGTEGLETVKELTDDRRTKINRRLKEKPTVEFWEIVLNKIIKSPFLLGHTSRNGWKCNIDWLVDNGTNCVKIWEGRYDKAAQEKG